MRSRKILIAIIALLLLVFVAFSAVGCDELQKMMDNFMQKKTNDGEGAGTSSADISFNGVVQKLREAGYKINAMDPSLNGSDGAFMIETKENESFYGLISGYHFTDEAAATQHYDTCIAARNNMIEQYPEIADSYPTYKVYGYWVFMGETENGLDEAYEYLKNLNYDDVDPTSSDGDDDEEEGEANYPETKEALIRKMKEAGYEVSVLPGEEILHADPDLPYDDLDCMIAASIVGDTTEYVEVYVFLSEDHTQEYYRVLSESGHVKDPRIYKNYILIGSKQAIRDLTK